jgi:hypothetical protein
MSLQIFGGRGFVGSAFVAKNPGCNVKERHDHTVDKDRETVEIGRERERNNFKQKQIYFCIY